MKQLNIMQIQELIPHRHPFLLIDGIEDYEPGEYAVGYKCVTYREDFFAGHFPDMPILPGVTQVDWAVRFARQYLKLDGGFSSLENVKFLALIFPDTRLQLALKWDAQTRRLDFSYANSRRKFSTGRVVFGASA